MRRTAKAMLGIALVLALAGCGGGSSTTSGTPLKIKFKSPALVAGSLPALYTCDGKDITPPVEWGAVPTPTKELALFVLGLKPNPTTGKNAHPGYSFTIEWALAGINPALHKLAAGKLPTGAHAGSASDGKTRYSVCPARGHSKKYEFALYAVPPTVGIAPQFTDTSILPGLADPESPTKARAGGAFLAVYKRR
jgi:phosphatidylethanolamine-binding protein (PEBP) family uncharacterized protein